MKNKELENVMNFCNNYLLFKVLASTDSINNRQLNNNDVISKQYEHSKKSSKGSKFEHAKKKAGTQQANFRNYEAESNTKIKTKKKKFQTHNRPLGKQQKQHINSTNNFAKKTNVDPEGYVSIQALIQNFQGVPHTRSNYDNNYISFGSNNFNHKQNQISNFYKQDYTTTSFRPHQTYISQQYGYNRFGSNKPYSEKQFSQSPIRQYNQRNNYNYYVPASRSKSPLGSSNSCTNLSTSNLNKSGLRPVSKSKKNKKEERSFFLPDSNNSNQKNNLQMSRYTSSNSIIAKFQRQIFEQMNEKNREQKQQMSEKSKIQDTRLGTKNKQETSIIKRQLEDYSTIQFDYNIKQSLSFLSEARGPVKPITIQMNK